MSDQSIEHYIAGRVEQSIRASALASDVYAFSLWLHHEDDDPRRPVLWLGSNTETQVESVAEAASSPEEARWNFAFWQQDTLTEIGGNNDADGAGVVEAWFKHDVGLWFTAEDEVADFDRAIELGQEMHEAFFRKAADAVALVHDSGSSVSPSGAPLPIIVHELEYHDEIAVENERVNPNDLLPPGFSAWCRGAA
jgi:hypothetical protein